MAFSGTFGARSRAVAVVAACTLVAVSVGVVHAASAEAPPQRVLQAVDVDLGADGTVYGIKGVTVRKEDGQKATTDKQVFDPSRTADQLPVRLLTSYRTAKGSGTDLRDLKGYDGRVEVDVTVQNTTVRPQQLSYDANGTRREASALVGVPLTVVASTNLGKGSVDRVVTTSDTGAVTNGVLAQDKAGNAVVQWASILAPPQLAPTTTFTLVMNAHDFSLPRFDLSVQPGLAADSSMKSLLDSAFGPSGGDELRLQSQTIELIGRVTGVLAQAGTQLVDVRRQLGFSAGTLGDRTVADLASGTQQVSSSTRALAGSLSALGDNLGTALQSSQSQTLGALKQGVDRISALLGDTSAAVPVVQLRGAACSRTVAALKPARTVYGQLAQVTGLLRGLAQAPHDCSDAIAGALQRSVGQVDANGHAVCPQGNTSAICGVESARSGLEAIANGLGSDLAVAQATINGLGIDQASAKLGDLRSGVTALQAALRAFSPSGSNVNTDLQDLAQSVRDLQHSAVLDLEPTLDDLHAKAQTALDQLGSPTDDGTGDQTGGTLFHQLAVLRQQITDSGATDPSTMLALVDGIHSGLGDQKSAWQAVLDGTDPHSAARAALSGLADQLSQLAGQIDQTQQDANGNGNDLDTAISSLQDLANALSLPPVTAAGDPVDLTDCANQHVTLRDPDPMSHVQQAFLGVGCARDGVNSQLATKFAGFQQQLADGSAQLEDQVRTIDTQRQATGTEVSSLFAEATRGLSAAGESVQSAGKKSVDSANGELVRGQQAANTQLSGVVADALKGVGRDVRSSTRDLQSAADLLSKDLANVLADLGTKDRAGSGLLGTVQAQVAQTRASGDRLAAAGSTASAFGNVRSQDMDGIFLQQAQLMAAVDRQAKLAPFAITLPNGSRHVSVYSFHMRAVR